MWHVFLDLDGTLTDPKEGIVRSIQYALRQLGFDELPEAELRRFIGPPLRDAFVELLSQTALVEEAVRLYRARFTEVGMFENALYPGVIQLLERMKAQRWLSYVITSKPTVYARRIVEHFALQDYFHAVYGSELDDRFPHKAELIAYVLEAEALQVERVVMVGDRFHDVQAASAHRIPTIGVTYGYGSRAELTEAGARWLCDIPEEIYQTLLRHFQ